MQVHEFTCDDAPTSTVALTPSLTALVHDIIEKVTVQRESVVLITTGHAGAGKTRVMDTVSGKVIDGLLPIVDILLKYNVKQQQRAVRMAQPREPVPCVVTVPQPAVPPLVRRMSEGALLVVGRRSSKASLLPAVPSAPSNTSLPPIDKQKQQPSSARRNTTTSITLPQPPPAPPQTLRRRSSSFAQMKMTGKRGVGKYLYLDGDSTMIRFDPIQRLTDIVSNCCIEFWLKTSTRKSCTLFKITHAMAAHTIMILGNCDHFLKHKEGNILFNLRDSSGRNMSLSGSALRAWNDNSWHHIAWHIFDAGNNKSTVYVDGKNARLNMYEQDGPHQFGGWGQQQGTIGASIGTHGHIEDAYDGFLADFKIWDCESKHKDVLVCHWSLQDTKGVHIPDMCNNVAATVSTPMWKETMFPATVLYFNGVTTHVNCGTMGRLGVELATFTVEFWMMSEERLSYMCPMGFSDSLETQGVQIYINKGSADDVPQSGAIRLHVQDNNGQALTAYAANCDLTDGSWHHVHISFYCEINEIQLVIDHDVVEVINTCEQNPMSFGPLQQWFCMGGCGVQGGVVWPFKGFLRSVIVSTPTAGNIAHWMMDEGSGSTMLADTSTNAHHGLISDRNCDVLSASWYTTNLPPVVEEEEDHKSRIRFAQDNTVRVASVVITVDAQTLLDNVTDVFSGEIVKMATPMSVTGGLPLAFFHTAMSASHIPLMYSKARALAKENGHAHIVFAVQIGSGYLYFLDPVGERRHTKAVWREESASWRAPVAVIGVQEKSIRVVNKSATEIEAFLLSHQTWAKLKPEGFAGVTSVVAKVLSSLVRMEKVSLHAIHVVKVSATQHETHATSHFKNKLSVASTVRSIMTVQKAVRKLLAKSKLRQMRKLRDESTSQLQAVEKLKLTFAAQVAVKATKTAIVIGISSYKDTRFPPFPQGDDNSLKVAESLTACGWNVVHLHTGQSIGSALPTRKNIMAAITTAKLTNSFLLVYWCSYGVNGVYFKWPTYQEHLTKWLALDGLDRSVLYAEQERERTKVWTTQRMEHDVLLTTERELDGQKEAEAAQERKALLKKEKDGPRKSWTRPQPPTVAPGKRRPSQANDAPRASVATKAEEEAAIEKRLLYLRAIQPLPFDPSPPIRIFPLPAEEPQRTAPFLYLIPHDAIYEMNRYYDVTLADLKTAVLGTNAVMGVHAALVVDVTCPFVLGSSSQTTTWSLFSLSSGEECLWHHDVEKVSCGFLTHYFVKAMEGFRCPFNLSKVTYEQPAPVNAGGEGVHPMTMMPYLARKLAAHDGKQREVSAFPATAYIGELVFAHSLRKTLIEHKHEKSNRDLVAVNVNTRCRDMLDVGSVTFRDNLTHSITKVLGNIPFNMRSVTSEGEWTLQLAGANIHDFTAPAYAKAVDVVLSELGTQAKYKVQAGPYGVDVVVRSSATMVRNTLHVHARIRTCLNGMLMTEQKVCDNVVVVGAHQAVTLVVETTYKGYLKLRKSVWAADLANGLSVERVGKLM